MVASQVISQVVMKEKTALANNTGNRITNDVDIFVMIIIVNIYYSIENSYLSNMGKSIFILRR